MKKVLGFSGSPVINSNTDRTVRHILESTACDYEFFKLSELNIRPCMACKACAISGKCIVMDDFQTLQEKIRTADGLVIGAYTPFSSIDAFTKILLERLFALHHNIELAGKKLITVVSSVAPSTALPVVEIIRREAKLEQMEDLGYITLEGTVPCATCPAAYECKRNSFYSRFGEHAKAGAHNCKQVEDSPKWAEAEKLGKEMGRLLLISDI